MLDKYYQLLVSQEESSAELYIYGDITSYDWNDKSTSANSLARALLELEDIDNINVYINSCGGDVGEGLAIYNALKRHKAKVTTYCDGFAASIASVIFMAGDERVMSNASLLFIHNAWTYTAGNSNELKKTAEDLEKITQASINAYMSCINIGEDELKQLLDDETWLNPSECLEKGFATSVVGEKVSSRANQSVRKIMFEKLLEPKQIAAEPQPKPVIKPKEEQNLFINLLEALV